jgi:hypothetical protein
MILYRHSFYYSKGFDLREEQMALKLLLDKQPSPPSCLCRVSTWIPKCGCCGAFLYFERLLEIQ